MAYYCRHPLRCRFACAFRPDLRCVSPWASPEDRFEALVRSVRSLALAAPLEILAMQSLTDIVVPLPCALSLQAWIFGEGPNLHPLV